LKHRRFNPPPIEIESGSPRDNRIDYFPFDFSFSIYTPSTPPSPKRQRISPPPFPYLGPTSPTFGRLAPPLMNGSTSSTVASIVSFTAESISPNTVGTMISSIVGVTPPPSTRNPNLYVGATPTVLIIEAMFFTMLGTPSSTDGVSTSSTIGASHSSTIRATFAPTINPFVPYSMGAQLFIGSGSLFSSPSSLPPSTPFSITFSMWSTPNIGNLSLNPQSSSAQTTTTSSQFAPSSFGMFHPSSGVSPFPSGSSNQNPNPGRLIGFPFGWNWNYATPHGPHNVGLAYTGSGSQMLGGNPSLGNVGGNAPLGAQSSENQSIPPPQQNVGFGPNPTPTQPSRGTLVSSQQPLGPTQTSFNTPQVGGSNVPPNPFINIGQIHQQPQQPINMGQTTSNIPYQQPSMGTSNVPPFVPSQGGSNYQPGGTYAPGGNQNPTNISLSVGFNPSQKSGYAMPYGN
jgi:hypothetical protein